MKKIIFHTFTFFLILMIFAQCTKTDTNQLEDKRLDQNWAIQSSENAKADGASISSTEYDASSWIPAQVPTTVLNALVEAGQYKDVYVDNNLEKIPSEQFRQSWWYRTTFEISDLSAASLIEFQGINYKANIWLNGKLLSDTTTVYNTFRQFSFNVSNLLKKGSNVLAIEVFPAVAGDFSIGFVDWNPTPPDNNMGVFRPVILHFNSGVGISNTYVTSKIEKETFSKAELFISSELTNFTDKKKECVIKGLLGDITFEKTIEINPNETATIQLSPSDIPALLINNPKLWWPHTMGEPNLYKLQLNVMIDGSLSDSQEITFGIREVADYINEQGHRGYLVNGQKILIRGGGWVDQLMLEDTPDYIKAQLEYVKHTNLNTIRLEGFWGKDETTYRLADEMGILIMVGWSCHWEWEDYLGTPCDETYGGILSDHDVEMMSDAWKDQIVWLRNHPSIFAWAAGSDCIPTPKLEENYFDIFEKFDSTRCYLASAKEWKSLAGASAVKMRGPYDYVPPMYWFSDTLYGGAFGFNTETGPGAQVPPLESLHKMLSAENIWPINKIWDYHCGRHEFNNLNRFTLALTKRYGEAKSVEEYARKAQTLNYELMRPMFEAFSANRYEATGVIQWMLNSAWPEMYWQLYDSYLMPNGAFYATRKACNPVHVIYNYHTNSIFIANDYLDAKNDMKMKVSVYNKESEVLFNETVSVKVGANTASEIFQIPEIQNLTKVYFLKLELFDNQNNLIDDNFYWLSTVKDVLDYETFPGGFYFHTPSKEYADFTDLNSLPITNVTQTVEVKQNGDNTEVTVKLKNTGNSIAFFIELLLHDSQTNLSVLPIFWSDNYFSLLPQEEKTITARFSTKNLKGDAVVISQGWNTNLQK